MTVRPRSKGEIPPQAAGAQPGTCDPRPPAILYVHLTDDALRGDAAGVARLEGVGPVTLDHARAWLGHCQVTVKPVIDLNHLAPVDGYEIPDRLREAIHLRSPVEAFPFATNTSRTKDNDHTDPYVHADHGGPPGQTWFGNLAPLTRYHHRIKTHSRWQVKQPFTGILIWRSPHGRYYLVDHTGTQRLGDTAA